MKINFKNTWKGYSYLIEYSNMENQDTVIDR